VYRALESVQKAVKLAQLRGRGYNCAVLGSLPDRDTPGAVRLDPAQDLRETVEFFGAENDRIAGTTYAPVERKPVGGMVVCPSICNDFLRNYRREVMLARRLGAQQVAVQRFHYRGTGNSDGEEMALTYPAMQADVARAVGRLDEAVGAGPRAFLGSRFGALLAASAASAVPGAPLILIDPVVAADRFFREAWRASLAGALREGRRPPGREAMLAEFDQHGSVDILGHTVGHALYASASGRTLMGELGDTIRPVLLMQLGGQSLRPDNERLVADLTDLGFSIDVEIADYVQSWWFFDEEEPPPSELVPAVAAWVAAHLAESTEVVLDIPAGRAVPPEAGCDAASPARETPGFFPVGGEELFGILTHPIDEPAGVAAVLLSGGAWTPSPGRNRIWVRLARELATRKLHSVRLDYHGVGESTGAIRTYVLDEPFVDDVRGACTWAESYGVSEFLLLGSCFGARAALGAAVEMEAVRGVALFPLPMRDHAMGDKMSSLPTSVLARKAASPHVLVGLFDAKRRRSYRRVLAKKRQRAAFLRRHPETDLAPFHWVSPLVVRQLTTLVDRRVPVLLVFGDDDNFYEDFRRGRLGPLGDVLDRAGDLVQVSLVPGKIHGLASSAAQDAVIAVLHEWLAAIMPNGAGPE
jgi:alpha/beta superfamily hydrolase